MKVEFNCGHPSNDPDRHYVNFHREVLVPPQKGDMIVRHKDGPCGHPRTYIYTVARTVFIFEDRESYTTPASIRGGYGGDRLFVELDFVEERLTAAEELSRDLASTMKAIATQREKAAALEKESKPGSGYGKALADKLAPLGCVLVTAHRTGVSSAKALIELTPGVYATFEGVAKSSSDREKLDEEIVDDILSKVKSRGVPKE
jgi:hypothetical protein